MLHPSAGCAEARNYHPCACCKEGRRLRCWCGEPPLVSLTHPKYDHEARKLTAMVTLSQEQAAAKARDWTLGMAAYDRVLANLKVVSSANEATESGADAASEPSSTEANEMVRGCHFQNFRVDEMQFAHPGARVPLGLRSAQKCLQNLPI